jgi:hypothetical protein
MSRSMVTRLFVGGIVSFIAGLVLVLAAIVAAFASNAFVMDGHDIVGFNASAATWTLLALVIVGGLAIAGGSIVGMVAWIGALLNTVQLDDKTWFVLLLVLGLLSFGFIAMVAYVIAGPDGTRSTPAPRTQLHLDAQA